MLGGAARTGTALRRNAECVQRRHGAKEVREVCRLDETGRALVRVGVQEMQTSALPSHCVPKLARTIADLAGRESIETVHLPLAIQHRPECAD